MVLRHINKYTQTRTSLAAVNGIESINVAALPEFIQITDIDEYVRVYEGVRLRCGDVCVNFEMRVNV